MKIIPSKGLGKLLRFAPDPISQTARDRLTLTLLEIYQIIGEAVVDRYPDTVEEARRIKRPAKKAAGAAVGHWDLVQGTYWVTYNETVNIPEDTVLFLESHPSLHRNGVFHASATITDWSEISGVLLMVGARGVRLTEGAPISVGRMIQL